ncbi:PREDICTED: uncharacterized protein LOC107070842 [Polistes dominula]|uniref:Uncharacterized protein LOC107070842 n=1 Tax=Polistes dominula TaxID=743375 RepID=A0ABM1IXD0_POLDO|nr:PREDICTED: uncharacterized protein LOC107070842 [Polistes dominula]
MNNINLHNVIIRSTHLPITDKEEDFIQFNKPDDKSWFDYNTTLNNVKEPQMAKLLEENTAFMSNDNNLLDIDENEILTSIKAVNRGISYSNTFLERQWRLKQLNQNFCTEKINANMSSYKSYSSFSNDAKPSNIQNTGLSNIQNSNANQVKNRTEDIEDLNSIKEILKQYKLSKNALILGLLNNKQITINDLKKPSKPIVEYRTSYELFDYKTEDMTAGCHLVQLPDDPDIYLHPLQLMDNSEQEADVNVFGVKKIFTAKQYYINNAERVSFGFAKRNVEKK